MVWLSACRFSEALASCTAWNGPAIPTGHSCDLPKSTAVLPEGLPRPTRTGQCIQAACEEAETWAWLLSPLPQNGWKWGLHPATWKCAWGCSFFSLSPTSPKSVVWNATHLRLLSTVLQALLGVTGGLFSGNGWHLSEGDSIFQRGTDLEGKACSRRTCLPHGESCPSTSCPWYRFIGAADPGL